MGKRPGVHFAFFLCCFYRRGYGVEGMRGQETASVALFCYFTSNVLGLLPPVCSTRPQSFSRTTSCQVFGGQLGKAPWHCTWRSPGVLPSRQNSVKLWAFVLWLGTLKEHKVFCVRLVSRQKMLIHCIQSCSLLFMRGSCWLQSFSWWSDTILFQPWAFSRVITP